MAHGSSNARRLNGVGVSPSAPSDGNGLVYNASTKLWGPASVANGTIPSVTNLLKGDGAGNCADAGFLTIDYAQLAADVLQVATLTLTSAQIRALHATPIQIVAAQGSGKLIIPVHAVFQTNFVTTDYTMADSSATVALELFSGATQQGPLLSASRQLLTSTATAGLQVAGYVSSGAGTGGIYTGTAAPLSNLPLKVYNTSGVPDEFAAGDHTLTVTVTYRVVAVTGY